MGLWASLKRTTNKQSVIPHSYSSWTGRKLGWELGWFLLLFCPVLCKHRPCGSESSGSCCGWPTHWVRKSEEAKSLWPRAHCLTFCFAKNHTPGSYTSILTSGLSQPRGLGTRFCKLSSIALFFSPARYMLISSPAVWGQMDAKIIAHICGAHSFCIKHYIRQG